MQVNPLTFKDLAISTKLLVLPFRAYYLCICNTREHTDKLELSCYFACGVHHLFYSD